MVLRVLGGLATLMFLGSAAVQFNDPDAPRWIAIYAAAALVSAWAVARPARAPAWAPSLVGLVACVWAGTIAPHVIGRFAPGELFASWEMHDTRIEEARETLGLLIVALWMAVLAIAAIVRDRATRRREVLAPRG